MANVRVTVQNALPAGAAGRYPTELNAVVAALEARDATIADGIRTEAARLGADRETVERGLVAVGLVPEAAALRTTADPTGVDVGAVLTRIEQRLGALENAAQRAGVRV